MNGLDFGIQKMTERFFSGMGSCLCYKNESGKFSVLVLTETVPAFASTPEAIEAKYTTSDTTTKIEGMKTLEDKEFEFFVHRDSINRLEKLKGKELELLRVNADLTGERVNGTLSYTMSDSQNGEAQKGNIKITPTDYIGYVENVLPLVQATVTFKTPIDWKCELDKTDGTYTKDIELNFAEGTFTATVKDSTIATAAVSDNRLTITGKAEGSTIVTLKASCEGYASWETTILVIVPKAVVAPGS